MNIDTLIDQGKAIVYDRDAVTDPEPDMFESSYWYSRGSVVGSAPGRGESSFLQTPFGAAVLRRYRRGGWAARFSEDCYLFTGLERSRPFREFRLLLELARRDLPVPDPLAALCDRSGACYRGALLTRTLPNVVALADALTEDLPQSTWESIGRCIRRFHAEGVHHADLNARNILLNQSDEKVFLIDFDRGRLRQGGEGGGSGNLARLHRSLEKCWPEEDREALSSRWSWLLGGYGG